MLFAKQCISSSSKLISWKARMLIFEKVLALVFFYFFRFAHLIFSFPNQFTSNNKYEL